MYCDFWTTIVRKENEARGRMDMSVQVGKQSLQFAEAPYIISSASIVGKKEGEGPLGNCFDVIGEDDKFGADTWEEAESTLQKEAFRGRAVSGGF